MITANILDLQEVYRPDFASADRQLWRSTVAEVVKRAKAAMDKSVHGRIDAAQAIVLAGDVKLLDDGTTTVASQSNGTTQYFVVNGTCTCKDFPRAPQGFCKHRLASAIAKRTSQARAIAEERMASEEEPSDMAEGAPTQAQPLTTHSEAPASVNVRVMINGREVQVTLRDSDEARLLARLQVLLAQYPLPEAPQAETHGEGWCTWLADEAQDERQRELVVS